MEVILISQNFICETAADPVNKKVKICMQKAFLKQLSEDIKEWPKRLRQTGEYYWLQIKK